MILGRSLLMTTGHCDAETGHTQWDCVGQGILGRGKEWKSLADEYQYLTANRSRIVLEVYLSLRVSD